MIVNNIKQSIVRIFDLYRTKGNTFFNFSLYFAFAGLLFAFILFYISAHLAYGYFNEGILSISWFDLSVITNPNVSVWASDLLVGLVVVQFGLYAIYLNMHLNDEHKKPKLTDFFNKVLSNNLITFLLATFLVCTFHILTFDNVFPVHAYSEGIMGQIEEFGGISAQEARKRQFYSWLNNIIVLIGTYLPYLGALFVLLASMEEKFNREVFIKYRTSILVVIILAFCFDAIVDQAIHYIDIYIVSLIKVPFFDSVPVQIFSGLVRLVIFAYFYLLFAAAILFPVIGHSNAETSAHKH